MIDQTIPDYHEVPITSMRKRIAKHTQQSFQTAPHFYTQLEVDMDSALAALEVVRQKHPGLPFSLLHLILKATGAALQEHPRLNARLSDDGTVIQEWTRINIGIVVALEDGILIPVVHDVPGLSLVDLAQRTTQLIERARNQRLNLKDLSDGTFTVSNVGKDGPDSFTSILNAPQSGVLSLGSVTKRPYVRNDAVVMAQTMIATLGADHRVVDGMHAARFLRTFKMILEGDPARYT